MIPHLMSLEEAKEIQYYTKFHHWQAADRRGNADGKYTLADMKDYMKQSNEERFVVVQIEDPETL